MKYLKIPIKEEKDCKAGDFYINDTNSIFGILEDGNSTCIITSMEKKNLNRLYVEEETEEELSAEVAVEAMDDLRKTILAIGEMAKGIRS